MLGISDTLDFFTKWILENMIEGICGLEGLAFSENKIQTTCRLDSDFFLHSSAHLVNRTVMYPDQILIFMP